jgi:hypothetical protein
VLVAELGVDYGQGFAMGRAQSLEELLEELAVYEASVGNLSLLEEAGAREARTL